jgi:hypothetical protein
MACQIPFVNSKDDWALARDIYSDSSLYRVTLKSQDEIQWAAASDTKFWVDTEVDALPNWGKPPRIAAHSKEPESESRPRTREFDKYFGRFPHAKEVANPEFWSRPQRTAVKEFVNTILDEVIKLKCGVEWLSVPQLPHLNGVERNEMNRILAESTLEWKTKRNFGGRLILPAIFTNQRQLNNKTERNGKVSIVSRCFEASGADGLWMVDSSLADQEVSGTFARRFKGVIKLHEEIIGKLPPRAIAIAGPYWALGLILWARGLVQHTAMGLGRGYQYYLPGGPPMQAAPPRLALPPLRQQVEWCRELKVWIESALKEKIPKGDPAYAQFLDVLRQFHALQHKNQGRLQVARFYRDWLRKFEGIPTEGRALALYQDFSSAYVLGKTLGDIPQPKDEMRTAWRVSEQFMMACL